MNRRFLTCLLAGLAAVVVGLLQLRAVLAPSGEAEATITRIESEFVDGEDRMQVYVMYTVDGTRYQDVLLDSYHVGMQVGDSVTVHYNLSDPGQIHTGSAGVAVIFFLLAGGALTLYGGGGLLWLIRGTKRG